MASNHKIIFHPYSSSTGNSLLEMLITEFRSGNWTQFHSSVAFLKRTGNFVDLLSAMRKFVEQDCALTMTFGSDLFKDSQGSDYEALKVLLKTFEDFPTQARFFLYHEKGRTFHPKLYLFSNSEEHKALVCVGSSNWSSGGLLGNIEANLFIELNLKNEGDLETFNQILDKFHRYWTETTTNHEPGQGFAKRVTLENVDAFKPLLSTQAETDSQSKSLRDSELISSPKEVDPDLEKAEELFRGDRISIPKKYRRKITRSSGRRTKRGDEPDRIKLQNKELTDYYLAWCKLKLAASDAQRQKGHPTGGVRLTQAKWEVDGQVIDQTTYFRDVVFGDLEWTTGIHEPKLREVAIFSATIIILGENYGQHEFKVSHKPSGEAGQGNYTTLLHWWGLTDLIKNLNLVNKKFELYMPVESWVDNNYLIEIS